MTNPVERIANRLKEIIDKNGPNYLMDEPYETICCWLNPKLQTEEQRVRYCASGKRPATESIL